MARFEATWTWGLKQGPRKEKAMNTYIRQIDGKWYAFGADEDNNQVYSIGSDCPKGGRTWYGSWTDTGIKYVACSSDSRNAAYQKARRNGRYCGEA